MPNPIYFPFGSLAQASGQQIFPYDLIINEAYPGLVLDPTEPSSVYSALREVSGCVWWVLNADYNQNTNQWEQDSPTNASLPAYALEQCQDGSFTRYVTAATIVPGNPITWTPVWTMDSQGYVTIEPRPATVGTQVGEIIDVTWTAGSSTQMSATRLNVTDTSSAATSFVQDERVNNNPVWQVQKDGTLITGIIPFARITGYTPPSFNNVTLTGTTTMTGPVVMESDDHVEGNLTVDGSITGNSTLYIAGHSDLHGGAQIESGLTVAGGETVTGGLTTDNLTVTGTATLPSSAYPVITSPDSSILVSNTPQAPHIQVATPVPAVATNSFTMPAVGATVDISMNSQFGFPQFSYVVVATNNGTGQFLGQVTTTVSQVGNIITQRVVNLQPQIGGPGTSFPAGVGIIFTGSWIPSLATQGQTYAAAANFAPGATTGSLSLSAVLPGDSSNQWLVIVSGSLEFQNASKQLTLTGGGAGVTWPSSPQNYQNANAGTFPFTLFGTAQGGSTPSVTWTCNDVLAFEPMTMTLICYFEH